MMRTLALMMALFLTSQTGTLVEQAKRTETAKELLERARGYDPECSSSVACRELLERVIDLDPSLAEAYERLAAAYISTDIHKSAGVCRKMEKALPNYSNTYVCLARYLLVSRDITVPESITLLRKAVGLDPRNALARRRLGLRLVYSEKRGKDRETVDEGIQHYRRGIDLAPFRTLGRPLERDMSFAAYLVNVHGRVEDSAALIDLILDNIGTLNNHEMCQLINAETLDEFNELEKFRRRMLKILAHCNTAPLLEGARFQEAGKTKEAIASFETLMEENPYHVGIYLRLPKLYLEMGQPEKARALIEKYFDLDEDPADRCKMKDGMYRHGYDRLAPELLARVKKECAASRNSEGKPRE